MNRLQQQVQKAKNSKFHLWLLNTVLLRTVPFNKPHGLKVFAIGDDEITIVARNIRPNQNHIKGIHACLLATLCEYVSGLSLLLKLDPKEYRIILKNINMTYHYQAKTNVHVSFGLPPIMFEEEILKPLEQAEAIFKEFEIDVYDEHENHICTGLINWQIKSWKNVKTKN
jgi:acyl-coenzyme A thioesterase PaaI-like protein